MSEHSDRRAERVRRALLEWDARHRPPELPEERAAEIRTLAMRAAVEEARASVEGSMAPFAERFAWAFAAAAGLLLVGLWLWWARHEDRSPAPAVVAEEAAEEAVPAGSEAGSENAPAERAEARPPVDLSSPSVPESPAVRVADLGPAPAATERRTAPDQTTMPPSSDSDRRIRRLEFQTSSGRKIHWVLDSEFRGVGGR